MHTRYRYVLLCLLWLAGCRWGTAAPPPDTLTVAAAASLSSAFQEVGAAFTAQSGIPVTFSFAATGTLGQQIRNGAPFDLFAAADTAHVDALIREGLLSADSRTVFAYGRLVLALAPGMQATALDDLRAPRFARIALANPEIAPFGLAARQTLEHNGLWEPLAPRLVFGENVRQVYQYVAGGDVQAAFVPLGFAQAGGLTYLPVPPDHHAPIALGAGIPVAAPHADQAARFLDFLLGSPAQAVLERHGFRPVQSIGEGTVTP